MKNQWTSLLFGMVKVKIEGRGTERFLNDCIRGDIVVWNVKRGKKWWNKLLYSIERCTCFTKGSTKK